MSAKSPNPIFWPSPVPRSVGYPLIIASYTESTSTTTNPTFEFQSHFVVSRTSEIMAHIVNNSPEPLDLSVPLRECLIETSPLAAQRPSGAPPL